MAPAPAPSASKACTQATPVARPCLETPITECARPRSKIFRAFEPGRFGTDIAVQFLRSRAADELQSLGEHVFGGGTDSGGGQLRLLAQPIRPNKLGEFFCFISERQNPPFLRTAKPGCDKGRRRCVQGSAATVPASPVSRLHRPISPGDPVPTPTRIRRPC